MEHNDLDDETLKIFEEMALLEDDWSIEIPRSKVNKKNCRRSAKLG